MKTLPKLCFHALSASVLVTLALLGGGTHDWMHEMDAAVPKGSIENNGSDGMVFATLLLLILILSQSIIAAKSKRSSERAFSFAYIAIGVGLWIEHFSPFSQF